MGIQPSNAWSVPGGTRQPGIQAAAVRTVIEAHGHDVVGLLGEPVHGQHLAAAVAVGGFGGSQLQGQHLSGLGR